VCQTWQRQQQQVQAGARDGWAQQRCRLRMRALALLLQGAVAVVRCG
jgi:hypothetical protein